MERIICFMDISNLQRKRPAACADPLSDLFLKLFHDLTDLRLGRLAAHLHEHCSDHLLIDGRIFAQLLLKILLCDKECGDCRYDCAGHEPAQ